ncbi:MAG: hypothetical protein WCL04_10410 [Verrucomicrobiota bacterium]
MANITIDWMYMGEALALLLFPLGLTLGGKVSWRSFDSTSAAGNDFSIWQSWVTVPALWLDVPRAYLGTMLLSNPDFALPVTENSDERVRGLVVLGVLGLAVLVQMFALQKPEDDDDVAAAPVSFLVGIMFALLSNPAEVDPARGLMVAGLATLVAMASASGVRSWHGFFLGGMVGLAPGYLLLGGLIPLLVPALLLFAPVLISLLFRRDFVVPVRRVV